MKTPTWRVVSVLACLLSAGPAFAGLTIIEWGTSAPPTTLGGLSVVPFAPDGSALATPVSGVALPATATPSGSLLFDVALTHYRVGAGGWLTWSNGYAGDVYALDVFLGAGPGGSDPVTITLPANTQAFYFYVEPGSFSTFDFDVHVSTASLSLGLLATPVVGLSGAVGFGMYTSDPTDPLTSVTVSGTDTWPDGFAIGEFGIDGVSGPTVADSGATLFLLGLPLLVLAALRRRFGHS